MKDYHQHTHKQAESVEQRWHHQMVMGEVPQEKSEVDSEAEALLMQYRELKENKDINEHNTLTTLSGLTLPRIVLPHYSNPADQYRWMRNNNAPGYFPFTAGVFRFKTS